MLLTTSKGSYKMLLDTSQLPLENWYEAMGDPTLAEVILDRLVHNAHKIALKGESMRKKRSDLTKIQECEKPWNTSHAWLPPQRGAGANCPGTPGPTCFGIGDRIPPESVDRSHSNMRQEVINVRHSPLRP